MTTDRIKVAIAGITGRMGTASCRTVLNDPELELVAAVAREDAAYVGKRVGDVLGGNSGSECTCSLKISNTLVEAISENRPQVLLDFTVAQPAYEHALLALDAGVSPIVGASGISEEQAAAIGTAASRAGLGALIVPNFSIGAVLMMEYATAAAKFFENAEIVEMHHTKKLDAPSGTALYTAKKLAVQRKQFNADAAKGRELVPGSRGATYEDSGLRVHSLRLPGIISNQEVLLASDGEMLTIKHQSFSTNCFVPGILMAIKAVRSLAGLVIGLEHLLSATP